MKRSELMLKLRLDFNNYIRKDYMKDKCEECGSNVVVTLDCLNMHY